MLQSENRNKDSPKASPTGHFSQNVLPYGVLELGYSHRKTVAACMLWTDEHGRDETELEEFGTLTDDLLSLKEWLLDHGCPVVVIESTGFYWHPVHNALEHRVKVEVVNARDIKNMPGRKTDMSHSKELSCLCRHGLIRSSFIPPKEQRQWRHLTTSRKN